MSDVDLWRRIKVLSDALEASLRWSYLDTADVVLGKKKHSKNDDPAYIHDVELMRAGLRASFPRNPTP